MKTCVYEYLNMVRNILCNEMMSFLISWEFKNIFKNDLIDT